LIFPTDFVFGSMKDLLRNVLRDNHDAIVIRQDQVSGINQNLTAGNGDVMGSDFQSSATVGGMTTDVKNRKLHLLNGTTVPCRPIENDPSATPIASRCR
jgi:hypothetical protein